MATFFASIHREIDFSKGYEFLEQELREIIRDGEMGKRIVDKLVKVYLFDGAERWLLIHIEIQGYAQDEFPERMYVYNYRIFDKYRKDVVSLALLTDDSPDFRPSFYRRSRWGCNVLFEFPVVKIIDYRERWEELEKSSNPFAIVVAAFLKTLETEGNVQERYKWKKHFILELYRRGMSRETILKLYKFIDWIMRLPKEVENVFIQDIKTAQETQKMPYITNAERVGMEKGLTQGPAKGLTQGLAKGLVYMLENKFGKASEPLNERVYRIESAEELEKLMLKLKRVKSLSSARKILNEIESPVAN